MYCRQQTISNRSSNPLNRSHLRAWSGYLINTAAPLEGFPECYHPADFLFDKPSSCWIGRLRANSFKLYGSVILLQTIVNGTINLAVLNASANRSIGVITQY